VLAFDERVDEKRRSEKIIARCLTHADGWLPSGTELNRLLAFKHGAVGDDIWQAALLEPIHDLTTRSAKQFRGQLVRMAYRLTSGTAKRTFADRQRCDLLAKVVELIHAGSLVVDDIEDGSATRRGAPALHVRYGVPIALNAGNWLYFWPFELIRKAGLSKYGEALACQHCERMLLRAHFGQALDVGANIETINQEQVPGVCLASMELKSGALMGFSLVLGGLLSESNDRVLSVLDEFGHDLGVALQMFDDLGNVQGKREPCKQYEDLLLHRPSWVWACAAEEYTHDDYRRFIEVVRKLPDRAPVERWFEESDLIEICRRRAAAHMHATFEALAGKLDEQQFSWSREAFRELRDLGKVIEEAYA